MATRRLTNSAGSRAATQGRPYESWIFSQGTSGAPTPARPSFRPVPFPAIQTVTLQRQDILFSPRRHGAHGDFTEASGFSVHLRVLRVSVVNEVPEFLSSWD